MKKLIKICWRVGTFSLACFLLLPMFCLANTLDNDEIPVTCKASDNQALNEFFAGREAFEMGRLIEANNFFDMAILKDHQFALAYLYKAYCAGSESEWKANINLAEQNKNPVSEGERILIEMESSLSLKNGKDRLAPAKHLVELYPLSARARIILAGEYQVRKEFTRFRELIRDAIQLDPKSPLGYRAMAASYLLNEPRDFELARNYMQKYIDRCPDEAVSHIALGDVYRAQLVWDLAIKAYDRAIQLDPKNDIAYSKRGFVNIYQGDFENARKDWETANKLCVEGPEFSRPNNTIVEYLFYRNGKYPTSETLQSTSNPPNINSKRHPLEAPEDDHYFCCTVISMKHGVYVSPYGNLNEYQAMQRELIKESKAPNPQMIRANITFLESVHAIILNDFKTATKKATEHARMIAPALKPAKLEVYNYLMGLIDLKQKHYDQAVDHYLKSDLSSDCVKFELGLAYDRLGEWTKAQKMFDDVSKNNFISWSDYQMGKISNNWLNTFATLPEEE